MCGCSKNMPMESESSLTSRIATDHQSSQGYIASEIKFLERRLTLLEERLRELLALSQREDKEKEIDAMLKECL